MLKLILGQAGSGKTAVIYDEICKARTKTLFFVPDQFIFETEKLVAQKTGEKSQNIKVTGFSSLCEDILKKYCPRKRYADSTAKLAIMLRTLRTLRQSLRFYTDAAAKNSFLLLCLDAVAQMKKSGLDADILQRVQQKADGYLKDKLADAALIYGLYNKTLTDVYDDRQDNLLLAARAAEENGCFAGCDVYIDGFDSFTGSQMIFLEQLIRQCDNCTVALCTDRSGSEVFAVTEKTRQFFIRTAQKEDIGIEQTLLSGAPRYKSAELEYLRSQLADDSAVCFDGDNKSISTGYCSDITVESDYVCAVIKKLVHEGLKYSDIVVLCASPSVYENAMTSAAVRYDIPLFADIPTPINEKPLLKYIDFLLAAAQKPTGENILRYIKSGFVRVPTESGKTRPITLSEMYDLEEYCNYWDIKARDWQRRFPHITNEKEERLEQLRQQTVTPLAAFAKSCDGCDGREITVRLTEFLFGTADISAAIQGKCQDYTTSALRYDKQLTEEYNQLWNNLSELLCSLYDTMKGAEMTLGEYASALRTCAQQINLSRPPQVLDSVLFGDPGRTRIAAAKAVFVMGAAEGSFPSYVSDNGGMFTKQENEWLTENEAGLFETDENVYAQQQLNIYKALTLASERLYITWTGTAQQGAPCVSLITSVFDSQPICVDRLSPLFFCESVRSAEKQLAASYYTDKKSCRVIENALKATDSGTFVKLAKNAANMSSGEANEHTIKEIAPLVFGFESLSPTAIDLLSGCRFAYFCRYGLKLRESGSAKMSGANFGNIMHYVLKYCFERLYSDGEKYEGKDKDKMLPCWIESAMQEYRKEFLLPEEEMSARFNALYKGLAETAFYVLKYMTDELEKSSFKPKYFELRLEKDKVLEDGFAAKPYSFEIELPSGEKQRISIGGVVDRVDIADTDNGMQLRVIDYKTGPKDISIGHIYYGLDLQLLLYLFTLCDNNSSFIPSAATYYPAGKVPLKDIKDPDAQLLRSIWLEEHKELGFSVEGTQSDAEKENYNADRPGARGMLKRNFFAATTISSDRLDRLKERVAKIVERNTKKVKSGDISAVPICDKGELISCKYCRFSLVCGVNPDKALSTDSSEVREFAAQIMPVKEKKEKAKKSTKTEADKNGGKQ